MMTAFKEPIWITIFLVCACLASFFRFGQRENDSAPFSDSDYYIDFATLVAGESKTLTNFNPQELYPRHHYARPLFPTLAAAIAPAVPFIPQAADARGSTSSFQTQIRSAFSVINILATTTIAYLLMLLCVHIQPTARYPWFCSILLIFSFPQINWGYHLLTDTLGTALSFASLIAGARYLKLPPFSNVSSTHSKSQARSGAIFVLLLTLAFLTRETAWIPVIALLLAAISTKLFRKFGSQHCNNPGNDQGPPPEIFHPLSWLRIFSLLPMTIGAKIPHALFLAETELTTAPIALNWNELRNPWYMFDFAVKNAACFHIAWVALVILLLYYREVFFRIPLILYGWGVASSAYIAAGYLANRIGGSSYPLRLSFLLAPLLFVALWDGLETFAIEHPERARRLLFCGTLAYIAVSFAGVMMDSAEGSITVLNFIH